ncbi:uncharacterized protein F4822DRAFT_435355 [Hypoxylon trugodes]|uniref:uncharacterized protein n=1 Tax=Hypoxylon trugodes TaxID=326681 RepID=UPI002198208E|nr:uncharacterized protein F4822DRAFT_435355 [Hypoxylon trugodes]KAI1382679.1 hypothetical protein F4822DRAFT_435355 [Hypoxylon trugodes]
MATVGDDINAPGKNYELDLIASGIDSRHCAKYRWYVERHLRRIYLPDKTFSRQLYYRRVTQKHDSELPPLGSNFKANYTIHALRPNGFNRIDYEICRAHYKIRETSQSLEYSIAKKRTASTAIVLIMDMVLKQYNWPEIVTDANVDDTLRADGVHDLRVYEENRAKITADFFPKSTEGIRELEQDMDESLDQEYEDFYGGGQDDSLGDQDQDQDQDRQRSEPSSMHPAVFQEGVQQNALSGYRSNEASRFDADEFPEEIYGRPAATSSKRKRISDEEHEERLTKRISMLEEKLFQLETLHQDFISSTKRLLKDYRQQRALIEEEYDVEA